MTIQLSDAVRNGMGNAIAAAIGTSAILKIRSGAKPATCATADSGTVLSTINLPSDWYGAFSGGVGTKTGTWQDLTADAAGTAGHYRLYASDGTTCHEQGTITATGDGGDLELDTVTVALNDPITITAFTKTMPGA